MNTNLLHDIIFARIFSKEAILICGPEEELDQHTLSKLFSASSQKGRCLKHALFLNPGLATANYLNDSPLQLDKDYFYPKDDKELIQQLSPLAVSNKNIIACGFPQWQNEQLSNILSNLNLDPGNPFLFFNEASTKENREYWEGDRRAYIEPSGIGLNDYVHRISSDYISYDPEIIGFEDDYQIKLQEEKVEEFERLKEKISKYFIIIKGLPGVGKQTFIKELKYRKKIGKSLTIGPYLETNYNSFLIKLAKKLKILFDLEGDNINNYEEALLLRMNDLVNVTIVIPSAHLITKSSERFQLFLLKWLINQQDFYTNNRVILVTEEAIDLNQKLLKEASSEIFLPVLGKEKTMLLCRKIFKRFWGSLIYTNQVPSESDQKQEENLFELVGGHPETIRILEEFCNKGIGIEEVLDQKDLQSEFLAHRKKSLSQSFSFTADELRLLEFLSLFDEEFEMSAIRELFPKPFRIFEQFTNRLLLEVSNIEGRTYYRLPYIIKKHIYYSVQDEEKEMYRSRISWYYQKKDLKSP